MLKSYEFTISLTHKDQTMQNFSASKCIKILQIYKKLQVSLHHKTNHAFKIPKIEKLIPTKKPSCLSS